MINYQIRRVGAVLGLFNPGEINRLYASGKLRGTDELERSPGDWVSLSIFLATMPAPVASSTAHTSSGAISGAATVSSFYVHSKGVRNGPLELSKISALVSTGLLDASAMLEDLASPGAMQPITHYVSMPAAPTAPKDYSNSQATSYQPASYTPVASSASAPSSASSQAGAKPKVTYLECWWDATVWIYAVVVIFGYLGGNVDGLKGGLLVGLLVAPIKGAFWGWIIWLIRK